MSESKDREHDRGKNKLTLKDVKEIMSRKGKETMKKTSEEFDVSLMTIHSIWSGKNRKLNKELDRHRESLLKKLCQFFVDEDTDSALKDHILANAKMEKLTASMGADEIHAFEEALK